MRQYFIDSRDRTSGSSTQFSVVLPQTLSLESGHQGRIDDLRLPNVIPTITSLNNTIDVLMSGTYYHKTLGLGQTFSGVDMENALKAVLTPISGGWTVQYITGRTALYIACTNEFEFSGGTFIQQLMSRPWHRPDNKSYFFEFVPLYGLDMCYLCSPSLTHRGYSVGPKGSEDVLCAIPITVPYGAVQQYSMSTSVFFDLPSLTTQHLTFELRDRDYNLVVSQANISFTFAID